MLLFGTTELSSKYEVVHEELDRNGYESQCYASYSRRAYLQTDVNYRLEEDEESRNPFL